MRTRKLGSTDLNLTVVGFGAWAIGGGGWAFGWGPQDDRESIAAIHRALDLGVNWIDTAAVYGLGHSEEVVARALAGCRKDVILATKCGLVWDVGSTKPYGKLKAASIRSEAEASLRRLRTDTIDLYQIHWPDPDSDVEEAWGEIARLIRDGKVRYGGVSNFSIAQIERARAIHPVSSLQPPYSMITRGIEEDRLAHCEKHGVGVVCYSPMQAGLLTGAVTRTRLANLPEDDWRRRSKQFLDPLLGPNLELVEGLRAIAGRSGRTPGQLAVAWVLRRPEVTSAIVGARSPRQIEETAAAGDWILEEEQIVEIEELLAAREKMLAS